jgi:hypothetical protein
MADPSEFPDLGPWVQVNRKKLMDIVAKSPFTQKEFERIRANSATGEEEYRLGAAATQEIRPGIAS